MNTRVYQQAHDLFREFFRCQPEHVAYAPGRVEVLGNHTDYNDGFVLSSAIEQGTFFLAAPASDRVCRIVAGDLREQVDFPAATPVPDPGSPWANYIKGVWAGLCGPKMSADRGFHGLFLGDVPLGAGLSSSAALEISSGLALAALLGTVVEPMAMARIGQAAEHRFAGVKCGLMDQITSLFGKAGHLVQTDFRALEVATIRAGDRLRFLILNTGVKHRLVDSHYNRRHEECRRAAAHFAAALPGRDIRALRDVNADDWETVRGGLDDAAARRALHVIGENARVLAGAQCLQSGDAAGFGQLMFASHESSRTNFENSCAELDFIVAAARKTPGVLGARLSGGGFGGGAVVLVAPEAAATAAHRLANIYRDRFGHSCATLSVTPAAGACLDPVPLCRTVKSHSNGK